MGTAIRESRTVHLDRDFVKIFYQEEKCQGEIEGTIRADKGNGQINPAQGTEEFIQGCHKAYGRKGKQDKYDKQKKGLSPEGEA